MNKTTQIWEIRFAGEGNKYIEATSLDDALQKARDWSLKRFKKLRKEEGKIFDEQQVAGDLDIEGVVLFVETDI